MKRIILILILCMAGTVHAHTKRFTQSFKDCVKFAPYVGVEYQYENITGSDDWRGFMPANFNNGAVFIGNRFNKMFGLEASYYHYLKTSQGTELISTFNGQTPSADTILVAAMRIKGFSVDASFHQFLDPKFNVFALIGLVTNHPHLTITNDGNPSDLGNGMALVKPRNSTYLRLGAGVEYLEKCWGARGRVMWDNTKTMKLQVADAQNQFSAIESDAFRNAIVVTVGLFYRF